MSGSRRDWVAPKLATLDVKLTLGGSIPAVSESATFVGDGGTVVRGADS